MGVGRMQIQQIIKRKSEVLDDYESNVSNDRKRKKHKTGNEDINDLCWDWVQDAIRRRNFVKVNLSSVWMDGWFDFHGLIKYIPSSTVWMDG